MYLVCLVGGEVGNLPKEILIIYALDYSINNQSMIENRITFIILVFSDKFSISQ